MLYILYPRYADFPNRGTYCAMRADSAMTGQELLEGVKALWMVDGERAVRLYRVAPDGQRIPIPLDRTLEEGGVRYGDPIWLEDLPRS